MQVITDGFYCCFLLGRRGVAETYGGKAIGRCHSTITLRWVYMPSFNDFNRLSF